MNHTCIHSRARCLAGIMAFLTLPSLSVSAGSLGTARFYVAAANAIPPQVATQVTPAQLSPWGGAMEGLQLDLGPDWRAIPRHLTEAHPPQQPTAPIPSYWEFIFQPPTSGETASFPEEGVLWAMEVRQHGMAPPPIGGDYIIRVPFALGGGGRQSRSNLVSLPARCDVSPPEVERGLLRGRMMRFTTRRSGQWVFPEFSSQEFARGSRRGTIVTSVVANTREFPLTDGSRRVWGLACQVFVFDDTDGVAWPNAGAWSVVENPTSGRPYHRGTARGAAAGTIAEFRWTLPADMPSGHYLIAVSTPPRDSASQSVIYLRPNGRAFDPVDQSDTRRPTWRSLSWRADNDPPEVQRFRHPLRPGNVIRLSAGVSSGENQGRTVFADAIRVVRVPR